MFKYKIYNFYKIMFLPQNRSISYKRINKFLKQKKTKNKR